jgi:hypothetical protein
LPGPAVCAPPPPVGRRPLRQIEFPGPTARCFPVSSFRSANTFLPIGPLVPGEMLLLRFGYLSMLHFRTQETPTSMRVVAFVTLPIDHLGRAGAEKPIPPANATQPDGRSGKPSASFFAPDLSNRATVPRPVNIGKNPRSRVCQFPGTAPKSPDSLIWHGWHGWHGSKTPPGGEKATVGTGSTRFPDLLSMSFRGFPRLSTAKDLCEDSRLTRHGLPLPGARQKRVPNRAKKCQIAPNRATQQLSGLSLNRETAKSVKNR